MPEGCGARQPAHVPAILSGPQVCLITGGDSGIGRAVALMYAREGAEAIAITYLNEERDANVRRHTLYNKKG